MTYPGTPAAPPAKPKGMLLAGSVLVVLSIVVFVGCAAWAATAIAGTAEDAPVFEAPGDVTTTLEAGEHAIWTNSAFLSPEDVTITGPGGEVASTDYLGGEGAVSLSRGGTSFSPEVTFAVPATGSYTVAIDDGGPSTDVLVGPPTSAVRTKFLTVAIAFVVSSLLGLIGLVLLIVGLVQRGRAKRAHRPPPGPYGNPGPPHPPAPVRGR